MKSKALLLATMVAPSIFANNNVESTLPCERNVDPVSGIVSSTGNCLTYELRLNIQNLISSQNLPVIFSAIESRSEVQGASTDILPPDNLNRNADNPDYLDRSAGDMNLGSNNTGHSNLGDNNVGNANYGSDNTGSRNNGSFNNHSGNNGSYNSVGTNNASDYSGEIYNERANRGRGVQIDVDGNPYYSTDYSYNSEPGPAMNGNNGDGNRGFANNGDGNFNDSYTYTDYAETVTITDDRAFMNNGSNNDGYGNNGSNSVGRNNDGDGNFGGYNSGNNNGSSDRHAHGNLGNNNEGYYNIGDGNTGYSSYNIGSDNNDSRYVIGDGNESTQRAIGNNNTDSEGIIGNDQVENRHTSYHNVGEGNDGYNNVGNNNTGYRNVGNDNNGTRNVGNNNNGQYNTGNDNIGDYNVGNSNGVGFTDRTGTTHGDLASDSNRGNRNLGDYNVGDYNVGDNNIGDQNIGSFNSGDRNTGNHNVGSNNNGSYNVGNNNTGSHNVGSGNYGERNIGDSNAGNNNIGDGNEGDYNVGSFNRGYNNVGTNNQGNNNLGHSNIGVSNRGDSNDGYNNHGNGNTGDHNTGDHNNGSFNVGNNNNGDANEGNNNNGSFNVGDNNQGNGNQGNGNEGNGNIGNNNIGNNHVGDNNEDELIAAYTIKPFAFADVFATNSVENISSSEYATNRLQYNNNANLYMVTRNRAYTVGLGVAGGASFPKAGDRYPLLAGTYGSVGLGVAAGTNVIFKTVAYNKKDIERAKDRKIPFTAAKLDKLRAGESVSFMTSGTVMVSVSGAAAFVPFGVAGTFTGSYNVFVQKVDSENVLVEMTRSRLTSASLSTGVFYSGANVARISSAGKSYTFLANMKSDKARKAYEDMMKGKIITMQELAANSQTDAVALKTTESKLRGRNSSYGVQTPFLRLASWNRTKGKYHQVENTEMHKSGAKINRNYGIFSIDIKSNHGMKERNKTKAFYAITSSTKLKGEKVSDIQGNFVWNYESNNSTSSKLEREVKRLVKDTGLKSIFKVDVPDYDKKLNYAKVAMSVSLNKDFVNHYTKIDFDKLKDSLGTKNLVIRGYVNRLESNAKKVSKLLKSKDENRDKKLVKALSNFGKYTYKDDKVFKAMFNEMKKCGVKLNYVISGEKVSKFEKELNFSKTNECLK